MPTKFKVKRSTVSGVTPTTGDIDTAELAINIPDRKLFTSNGTTVYELGSNQTNLSVSANLNIGASGDIVLTPGAGISANGGLGTAGYALHSNGSSVYWALPNSGISAIVSEQFTANGTSNSFTVTGGYIPSAIEVYVSGVKQVPVSDVIITSGSTVDFITAPLNGQVVDVFGYKSTNNISSYLALTGGTLGGNLIFANGSVIVANGSLGTSGQVLTSNGTSMYWDTATINVASQYAWTNTHTFAANVAFDTNTLFVDATNDEVGIGTTAPSAKLDIVGASNIRAFETTATISNTVATTYANYLDVNISGSDVLAADIVHAGLAVDVDSTATSGNTTTEHIIYGTWSTVDVTGPSNRIYGLYSDIRANNSVGTIGQLYGNYNLVEPDPVTGGTISDAVGTYNLVTNGGNGAVADMFGAFNKVLLETTGTPTLTNGYGSYNEVEIDGNAITVAYGTRSAIDIDGGTIGTGYLYYGDYQGANATNLTTSYGLYLTGETQNYISGNVGIGNTAPNAKLQVTGTANVSGNVVIGGITTFNANVVLGSSGLSANGGFGTAGQVLHSNGTAAYWTTATAVATVNTAAQFAWTNTHTFAANVTFDTSTLFVDATNDRVGVGTASPGAKLDVSGVVRSTGTSAILTVSKRSTGTGDAWGMYSQSGELNLYDYTAAASRMVIDTSGNVGIGTTTPDASRALTLNRTGNYGGIDFQVNGSTQARLQQESTGNFYIDSGITTTTGSTIFRTANGSERMRIDSSGNVGIGNTAPNAKLQVTGTANISSTVIIGGALTSANLTTTTNTATFGTAAYVVANGNVGISNSAPVNKLHVTGDTSVSSSLYLGATTTVGSTAQLSMQGYNAGGGTGYHQLFAFYNTYSTATNPYKYVRINSTGGIEFVNSAYTAVIFTMANSGDFTASGNITAYSDIKLKTNIHPIQDALTKVQQMQGVSYNRKSDGEKKIGFIAQDLQKVLPEVVIENHDGILSVDYGNIVALLTEAIKEQQKQIEIQNENIKRLQVELERLKE